MTSQPRNQFGLPSGSSTVPRVMSAQDLKAQALKAQEIATAERGRLAQQARQQDLQKMQQELQKRKAPNPNPARPPMPGTRVNPARPPVVSAGQAAAQGYQAFQRQMAGPSAGPQRLGMKKGGMAARKGYADGGMPMVMKDGKKVPSFAADGKGKMAMGGMATKNKGLAMKSGGPVKMAMGGMSTKEQQESDRRESAREAREASYNRIRTPSGGGGGGGGSGMGVFGPQGPNKPKPKPAGSQSPRSGGAGPTLNSLFRGPMGMQKGGMATKNKGAAMKHGGMAHGKAPKGRGMAIMIAIGKPKGRGKS